MREIHGHAPPATPPDPMSTSNAQAQIELHKALAPRYAYRYSFEFSRLFQEDWHREMMAQMPAGPQRVLDLGCGTGFFLAELEERCPGSVGLDISHAMLCVSEQYVPSARVLCADAERLPFEPSSFDVVFCKGSLHHTRDHIGFLEGCRRSLEKEGVLVMSEPCNDNPIIRGARYLLYKLSPHFDLGDQGFTRRGIEELCRRAGFSEVEVHHYGIFSYVFAGFPDHVGLLRWIPGNAALTRGLIALDRWICKIPLLKLFAFQLVVRARPGSQT